MSVRKSVRVRTPPTSLWGRKGGPKPCGSGTEPQAGLGASPVPAAAYGQ